MHQLAEHMYFPGTSSSENCLTFHGDKMGGKDHCHVTTGQIKARNFAERLSFSFSNKAKYCNRH